MWTRAQLKQNAKNVLKNNYWMALLVCLVFTLIVGGISGAGSGASSAMETTSQTMGSDGGTNMDFGVLAILGMAAALVGLGASLVSLCCSFFLSSPLAVGKSRYFLESRANGSGFDRLFFSFKNHYLSTCGSVFLTNLFIGLWSLLLLVPGIVKAYQWTLVPYLLAENPGMTGKRARALSSAMTDGEKWNILVLDLSFLGWGLLAALTCGIGVVFLTPYIEATKAELYAVLREKALANGTVTPEELPGV